MIGNAAMPAGTLRSQMPRQISTNGPDRIPRTHDSQAWHAARAAGAVGLLLIAAGFLKLDAIVLGLANRINTPDVLDHDLRSRFLWLWDLARLPGSFFGVAAALLATALLHPRGGRLAAAGLAAVLASSLAAVALQHVVGRVRPSHAADPVTFVAPLSAEVRREPVCFPSGEVTVAFALAVVVAHADARLRPLAFGWASATALARMLAGAHYFSDVVAGGLLGAFVARAVVAWAARCRVV